MYHLHLKKCDSTQNYLKENLTNLSVNGEKILVSTQSQLAGVGRSGKSWMHIENSLAFSFTLKPTSTLTLTPLEIGILVCDFIKNLLKIDLYLKWPNDIMTHDNKKCGGIVINYISNEKLIVGIGLNIGTSNISQQTNFDYAAAQISSLVLSEDDYKNIPYTIVDYIYSHRIDNQHIVTLWKNKCSHMNSKVKIVNSVNNPKEGEFIDLSSLGEAIIMDEKSNIHKCISGSLRVL